MDIVSLAWAALMVVFTFSLLNLNSFLGFFRNFLPNT